MAIVRLDKVSKVYGKNKLKVHAVTDVSFEVQEGEFLAIVGPSGSGKTTLLNLIGGIDRPSKGKVYIEDQDITLLSKARLSDLRLKRIGFIFQEYNLIPVLTAVENIELGLLLLGIDKAERRERVNKIIKDVGILELANRRPKEMSGGQQQRVAVARAMVTKPAVILADEPTANLDSNTGISILRLMQEMNHRENITFIFSTHDPMVMEMASRVIILRDGRIESEEKRD